VRIGIVDTGVDLLHQDLAGKVVAQANCIGSNGDPSACSTGPNAAMDDNGHGTHVAGIAAADTNNGKGVAGMAPSATIVAVKALDSTGSGSFSDVNAGIEWAVEHGARVVNLSLGSASLLSSLLGFGSNSLSPGIEFAWSHGAIPVIAAGNTNFFGLGSANYGSTDAVVVGATGPNDEVAPYSSPLGNAKWGIVAPGGDGEDSSGNPSCTGSAAQACILSTFWTPGNQTSDYQYDEGTSMATPFVSGTLALLLARGLSPSEAVSALLSAADKSVACGSGCWGRLDAAAALAATSGMPSSSSAQGASSSPGQGPSPGAGGSPPADTAGGSSRSQPPPSSVYRAPVSTTARTLPRPATTASRRLAAGAGANGSSTTGTTGTVSRGLATRASRSGVAGGGRSSALGVLLLVLVGAAFAGSVVMMLRRRGTRPGESQ
jgi:subtilisin family serine protease